MPHLVGYLRRLREDTRARRLSQTSFCDACGSTCAPTCREDSQRAQPERMCLRAGLIWR